MLEPQDPEPTYLCEGSGDDSQLQGCRELSRLILSVSDRITIAIKIDSPRAAYYGAFSSVVLRNSMIILKQKYHITCHYFPVVILLQVVIRSTSNRCFGHNPWVTF